PPLPPLQSIVGSVLIGEFGLGQPLVAAAEPCSVHHDEHRRQSLVLAADKPTRGAVEVHGAGGTAMHAHLVLYRAAAHGIATAIGQHLRHEEQRDAARALWCARKLGENQMNDVVGEVVLTA